MWWLTLVGVASATPEFDAVVQALQSRDPVACATLEALTPTPTETLLQVVDEVPMPPWAPMRAADCLLRGHPTELGDRLQVWVTDPALLGLGRLVLGRLDALPVEVSVPVARAALVGSAPELAKTRILAATTPEVRAVVTP